MAMVFKKFLSGLGFGVFAMFFFGSTALATVNFLDVKTDTRYREAIVALAGAGIVKGRPDGTFGVFESLKRAELVQLILKSEDIVLETFSSGCFSDVNSQNQWFFQPVCTAKKRAIAQGYKDGTFRPGNSVNRAEAIALLCRTQQWKTSVVSTAPFADIKTDDWFATCVAYAKEKGFLKNVITSTRFIPGGLMARGAFSEILYRSLLARGKRFEIVTENFTAPLILATEPIWGLSRISDIQPLQREMLNLVNGERAKEGLAPYVWSDELAEVAQGHSNDMVRRSFFDHVNPDGATPEDRRRAAGIFTGGGENLAKAPSLEQAHSGLMNSPPHRRNIMNTTWLRMGIGIAQDAQGYLLITQLFSLQPVKTTDLSAFEIELRDLVDGWRQNAGLPIFQRDNTLDQIATVWSQQMATENFFAVQTPTGEKLVDRLRDQTSHTIFQIFINESNQLDPLRTFFENNQTRFTDQRYRHIALGFALDNMGFVKLTVLLTD